jgi:hypothetical protein
VLIETHGALREVEEIAALPGIETLDFGLMDFVSGHHGAIPSTAMKSPGQFDHPLVARAKCAIAAAALGHGLVPSHNVTTELHDTQAVYADARRAREQFGYLRMWSIHPNQVQPIVDAMRPNFDEVNEAAGHPARRAGRRLGADPPRRPPARPRLLPLLLGTARARPRHRHGFAGRRAAAVLFDHALTILTERTHPC